MKRLAWFFAALIPTLFIATVVLCAPTVFQEWSADQSGTGAYGVYHVNVVQDDALISGATQCVEADVTGTLIGLGVPCGSGAGGVTSVTATAPIFSSGGTTPNITEQGAIVSGSTSTTAQNLGSGTNGTLEQTVSAGVATVSEFNGTTGSVPFYTTSGQLAQNNADFFYDNSINGLKLAYSNSSPFVSGGNSIIQMDNTFAGTGQTNMVWTHNGGVIDASSAAWIEAIGIVYFYTPGVQGFQILNSIDNSKPIAGFGGTGEQLGGGLGTLATHSQLDIFSSTSSNAIWLGQAATQIIDKHGGQFTLQTDDSNPVVLKTNATPALTLTTGQTMLIPANTAPATPAAATGAVYEDSTSKNLCLKNDAGTINHGVQTKAAVTSNFLTAIADSGAVSAATAAFSDVTGSLACSQTPAYTGGVGKPAGSCTTTVNSVPCGALPALTGQVLNSGGGTCATTLATNTVAHNQIVQSAAFTLLGNSTSSNPGNVGDVFVDSNTLGFPGGTLTVIQTAQVASYQYNFVNLGLVGGFGGLWEVSGPINAGYVSGGVYEYAPALAVGHARLAANITLNSLTGCGAPGSPLICNLSRNGSTITTITIAAATGVLMSTVAAVSGALGDTYGLDCTGTCTGGTFSGTITVNLYQ